MAGVKETPRQKMIGMMYLVLTALLALQVSSAIILKFKFLDDSLMNVNQKTIQDNTSTVSNIQEAVSKGGNRPIDRKVLEDANRVRTETKEIVDHLHALREEMIARSGGRDEATGGYNNPKEEEKIAIMMIGGRKDGEAYALKDKLNEYAGFLRNYNPNVGPLAVDAKDDPIAGKDPDQRNKDFAELNFGQTPLVAALAVLAQKEAQVLNYEADVLQNLAGKVGADIIKFDKLQGVARAESRTVAAGTKYSAEMFITASSSALTPTMTYGGRPVKVDADGRGRVEFVAQAGNYDKDGNSKQTWTGQIKINTNGRDTTFTVKEDYIVAKPVIQIQSGSVRALYFNCGNELDIQVPALGPLYDPSFSASGGSTVKGSKKGEVIIIPNAKEVRLNVSSGGNAIGSETFPVRPVPKPDIVAVTGGRPVNELQGMAAPGPRMIEMRAIPDAGFKDFLPNDARFRVTEYEVSLVRGKRRVHNQTFTSPQANLTAFAAQAQPGDRIAIQVKEVQRMNFRNNVEPVNIGERVISIPLN
jgi:gliding motility-associated protein GldM